VLLGRCDIGVVVCFLLSFPSLGILTGGVVGGCLHGMGWFCIWNTLFTTHTGGGGILEAAVVVVVGCGWGGLVLGACWGRAFLTDLYTPWLEWLWYKSDYLYTP
jgi:hypothetical protein